jgi:hypothetical protein
MEGSVFPKDIYLYLFDKCLGPRDQLLLSMTCKKLYSLFTPWKRKFMSLDLEPRKEPEWAICDEREWDECKTCFMRIKKENMHKHKCMFRMQVLRTCRKCMVPFSAKRYKWHTCMGRITAGRICAQCKTIHKRPYDCIFKETKCVKCSRNLPAELFTRHVQCELCDDTVIGPLGCFTCSIKRCYEHKKFQCTFCCEYWDPFGIETTHNCKDARGRVTCNIVKTLSSDNNTGGIVYWDPDEYTYPGLFHTYVLNEYVAIYFVKSLNEIPTMMFMRDNVMIFLGETQLASFSALSDFMWIRSVVIPDKPPRYCSRCMATNKSNYYKCSRCKRTKYCSQECQEADWKYHKYDCLS